MKLRVKHQGQAGVVTLADCDDGSQHTLAILKQAVCEKFALNIGDVEVSLNKQDALAGEETVLSEFGIVPGDLIHTIVSGEAPAIPQGTKRRSQPIATYQPTPFGQLCAVHNASNSNNSNEETPVAMTSSNGGPTHSSHDMEAESTSHTSQEERLSWDTGVQRSSVDEPFVIRESTANHVPVLLQELYQGASVECANDALFVLLHALMIESGFSVPDTLQVTQMPDGWKKATVYVCRYTYVLSSSVSSSCCLMAVSVGTSIAVHGLCKEAGNFKTEHLQLRADNYVRDCHHSSAASAYRSLERLSTLFKESVGNVLQNHLATSAGFRETQGLLSLPTEIKMRVLCFLDPKSVCSLGQTCQQMNSLSKDNSAWRRLYLERFGTPADCRLSQNWYEMFRDRYEMFLSEQRRRRQFYANVESEFSFPHHPRGPYNPFNPGYPLPVPRLLGGDHDLRPHLPGLQDNRRMLPESLNPFRSLNPLDNRRGNRHGGPFGHPGTFL